MPNVGAQRQEARPRGPLLDGRQAAAQKAQQPPHGHCRPQCQERVGAGFLAVGHMHGRGGDERRGQEADAPRAQLRADQPDDRHGEHARDNGDRAQQRRGIAEREQRVQKGIEKGRVGLPDGRAAPEERLALLRPSPGEALVQPQRLVAEAEEAQRQGQEGDEQDRPSAVEKRRCASRPGYRLAPHPALPRLAPSRHRAVTAWLRRAGCSSPRRPRPWHLEQRQQARSPEARSVR
jgi:hypothetical protein